MNIDWLNDPVRVPDSNFLETALSRQNQLTKPPGSLGQLETIAVRLAATQGSETPGADKVHIVIFAGDHGIADEGVSAFPQAVTVEMIRNFSRGGAAISVIASELGATFEVVNTGTAIEHEPLQDVLVESAGQGTANFSRSPAMTTDQLALALNSGRQAVARALDKQAQVFIAGDMGIANTTAATAIACALLEQEAGALAGPGTGLDSDGIRHKVEVIDRSIALHREALTSPQSVLQHLGGFEIAAMSAAYIACAQQGLPAVVDGFIATVAALVAIRIAPEAREWLFFAHASAEPGHRKIMQAIDARPLIDFDMRLGEGSGAAVVVPLMRMACALHNGMATFEQAGVSNAE